MPFNGAGVYSPPGANYPAVSLTVISSVNRNAIDADIATALSSCITKDGQQTVTGNIPMNNFKITGLGLGTAATDAANVSNANLLNMCEFRLSLTTGVPVTTADVNAAGTIYMTPFRGNRIALYNGTNWHMRSSAEMSIAVPAAAAAVYDVFCYDNATVATLELLVWTNDTTRATALTLQDGVLSKTGDTTRRYIGTFRTILASQCTDSVAFRHLWNYYNRVRRPMRVLEATDTWNYTTAVIRQANNSTANQLDFVVGVSEDIVTADIRVTVTNGLAAGVGVAVGVGLDSTAAFASGGLYYGGYASPLYTVVSASWKGFPGAGRHYLSWNEYSAATNTTTWLGDGAAPTILQSGIHGEIMG